MKIFNVMFSKVNGGLEQVFLNYTPTLKEQGNHVLCIIHPKAEILPSCPKEDLITVHNFNQHDIFAIRRLRKLVLTEKPDCIITHSYRAAYLFKKTKTPVPTIAVCHVRGHYNFGTDAIIAITESMRQDIIASGYPANKVFTVPNMVSLPKTLQYRAPKNAEVPVIGVCARFAEIKGVDIFIQALAELKNRQVPFKARLAGDGKEKERYLQMIDDLQLKEDITLLGWVEDRPAFYDSIDIFCLPSREEAFGLVVLESMLHSLPMVLSELPGPLEIVADSQSAVLVQPNNPQALADGLERVIRDQELAKQLSVNAFNRVQHFSNKQVGPVLHRTLEQVCLDYQK